MHTTTEMSITIVDDIRALTSKNIARELYRMMELGEAAYSFPGENIELNDEITLWNLACIESVDYSDFSSKDTIKITIRYHAYDPMTDLVSTNFKIKHYLGMTDQDIADAQAELNDEMRKLGDHCDSGYYYAPYIPIFLNDDEPSTEDKVKNLLGL